MLITKVGWYRTKSGKAVAIQYWDHDFQPSPGARWRGMVVKEAEDRTIVDWVCLWYTIFGEGHFPDYRINLGDWDIERPLKPDEIPVDKPEAWMPGYDDTIRKKLRKRKSQ